MRVKINLDLELKKNEYKGLYIVLEGIDGSGKSTQVARLANYFKKKGRRVIVTREPRKEGVIGDLVSKVLTGKVKLPSESFQYLFSADRAANHAELIIPELKRGSVVISDRNFFSALVYGILDKTSGKYDARDLNLLLVSQSILSMYHQFTLPDYTFYLKISLPESLSRLSSKSDEKEIYEDRDKLKKLIEGYEFLKAKFPKEIIEINGEQSVEKVTQEIIKHVDSDLIGVENT